MNSNPGTHNGMTGLEKEIHRSTDRVHSEKASIGTELQQPDAWPSCMSEATIRALLVQTAAFAKSGCWFLWLRNINARGASACLSDAACCMTH